MRFISIFLVIVTVMSPAMLNADWVDDIIGSANASVNYPSTFEGQQRGYFSAGGISFRYTPKTDYLFSVEPPRIRAGCGGIDIYLGSFSYLRPEYLVEKLKKILKIAPAMAFQLAMSTLCEPCENIMSKLEAITNAINNLQIDECQASKALVAYTMDKVLPHDSQKLRNEAERAEQYFNDQAKSWMEIGDSLKQNDYTPESTFQERVSECGKLQEILEFGGKISFVDYALEKRNVDSNTRKFVSAAFGDIKKEFDNQGLKIKYQYISSCITDSNSIKDVKVKGRNFTSTFNCTDITQKTFKEGVVAIIDSIVTKMKNKQALTSSETTFVSVMPLSVYSLLKIVASGNESLRPHVIEYAVNAYLYYLYMSAYEETKRAKNDISRNMSLSDTGGPKCQVAAELTDLSKVLDEFAQEIDKMGMKIYSQYMDSVSALNEAIDAQRAEEQMYEEMQKRFYEVVMRKGGNKK